MAFSVSYKHFCIFSHGFQKHYLLKEEVNKVAEGTSGL